MGKGAGEAAAATAVTIRAAGPEPSGGRETVPATPADRGAAGRGARARKGFCSGTDSGGNDDAGMGAAAEGERGSCISMRLTCTGLALEPEVEAGSGGRCGGDADEAGGGGAERGGSDGDTNPLLTDGAGGERCSAGPSPFGLLL